MPPDPPTLFTLQWLYQSKRAGSGPAGCILETPDVSSLYANTPHGEWMEACRQALDTRQSPDPPTSYLIRMME